MPNDLAGAVPRAYSRGEGWRAWSTTLLGVVLVSCGSGPDPIEATDAPRTYELVCGDMNRLECEVTATEFAADAADVLHTNDPAPESAIPSCAGPT